MTFPKHIADRSLRGNPAEIIRALFTYHSARFLLSKEGFDPLKEAYPVDEDQARNEVRLLRQVIDYHNDEVVDDYFRNQNLHMLAIDLVSEEALDGAEAALADLCLTLEPQIADWMLEFLFLFDPQTGELRAQKLYELDRQAFYALKIEINQLLPLEMHGKYLQAVMDSYQPVLHSVIVLGLLLADHPVAAFDSFIRELECVPREGGQDACAAWLTTYAGNARTSAIAALTSFR